MCHNFLICTCCSVTVHQQQMDFYFHTAILICLYTTYKLKSILGSGAQFTHNLKIILRHFRLQTILRHSANSQNIYDNIKTYLNKRHDINCLLFTNKSQHKISVIDVMIDVISHQNTQVCKCTRNNTGRSFLICTNYKDVKDWIK